MARYQALRDLWISHECRHVRTGEVFETTFPEGMRLGESLKLVEADKKAKPEARKNPDELA